MSVFKYIQELGHEHISVVQNRDTKLLTIIAVHDTTLGPALGGCRINKYETIDDAFQDVLGLSESMTYKNSLCGLNFGGGKSVIVADRKIDEGREKLFESFGKCVEALKGMYITAEDMGTSVEDMNYVMRSTKYVAGRDPAIGGAGDPSPYTAKGVFGGIQACLERKYGQGDFTGKHVSIQGVGHVGKVLAQLLSEAGAKLTISDTRKEALEEVSAETGATVVEPDAIYATECDVFAPCAFGGAVNPDTVGKLKCGIVAGAANVQIEGEKTEQILTDRGILYAPDFAINAGGVILCADEFEPGGFTESRVMERVDRIYGTVGRVLDESAKSGELPGAVAVRLAKERIEEARQAKQG